MQDLDELIVADSDFELRRGPALILLAQLAGFSYFSHFLFSSSKIRRRPGSPGPLPLDPPTVFFYLKHVFFL